MCFKFNEKWGGVSWKISSLSSLNFPFLTVLPDTVFIFVGRSCEFRPFWAPDRMAKRLRVSVPLTRRVFSEAYSLQFFVLLKLEERVCGEK